MSIDDGKIRWQHALPAGIVHAIAGHGDVIGVVIQTTPWTGKEDASTIIHAELVGVSMATGAEAWTLSI